jgi:hypothetical protein
MNADKTILSVTITLLILGSTFIGKKNGDGGQFAN